MPDSSPLLPLALLSPDEAHTEIASLDLGPLEAQLAPRSLSLLSHLPEAALSPPADWHPEGLLLAIAAVRLRLSQVLPSSSSGAEELVDKPERDLTPEERELLTRIPARRQMGSDGVGHVLFSRRHAEPDPARDEALRLLAAFGDFVALGRDRALFLRRLDLPLPEPEPPAPPEPEPEPEPEQAAPAEEPAPEPVAAAEEEPEQPPQQES